MSSRRRRAIVSLTVSFALALAAGAVVPTGAQAETNAHGTLALSAPADAVEDRPFRVTYRVSGPQVQNLWVFAKPVGSGTECVADPWGTAGVGDESTLISHFWTGWAISGTQAAGETYDAAVPDRPGTMVACGYVSAGNTIVLRETLQVPVRGSRATVSVTGPDRVTAGRSADVVVAGTTEARRPVSATIVAGDACPAPGGDAKDSGPGSFERTLAPTAPEGASGPGRLCAWVTDGDEVEAVASRPIQIDPAPGSPPPTCATNAALCPSPPACPTGHARLAAGSCATPPRKLAVDARRHGRLVTGTATAAPARARVALSVRGSRLKIAEMRVGEGGSFRLRVPVGYAKKRLVVRLTTRYGSILLSRTVQG